MKALGTLVASLLAVLIFVGGIFGLQWIGLEWKGFIAPKARNVEREVFEETKSYNQGKIQQLIKYRYEFIKGDGQTKRSVAAVVRHAFPDYPLDSIKDTELRDFLSTCRSY